MLVLSRTTNESIMIGPDTEVTILDIRGPSVRIGIAAPKDVPVHRREVFEAIQRDNAVCSQCHGAGGFPSSAPHMQKCVACGGTGRGALTTTTELDREKQREDRAYYLNELRHAVTRLSQTYFIRGALLDMRRVCQSVGTTAFREIASTLNLIESEIAYGLYDAQRPYLAVLVDAVEKMIEIAERN